ncbi:secA DEAD-like domain-containing protein [Ditylenchus destructor]|nr:secA DEAD-like domain-containing protein [Ditylenchus destructor]
MQAVYLHTERSDEFKDPFYPRDAQILVVMIYLYRKKALFGQVGTGEGKSIDIIMISAAYALMGKKVHVVTSSTYLAKRDSDAAQDFFRSVGLKVSQNSDPPKNRNGFARLCYTGVHVVYGTGFSFARDILHHTFSGNNTMGEHFKIIGTSRLVALIDEVDDLAIDNKHIFTRLLSRFPGADLLEPLMTAMYEKSKKKHDPRKRQRGGATTESATKAVIDFLTTFAEEKIKTYKDLAIEEKKLKENKMTPEEVDSTKILLPLQFDLDPTHFARKEARNWAEAFFKAERMHKNVHYFINEVTSAINVVDNARTGQVYDNRQYDHGLQQGIAYKEQNVKLTPISLITSFLNTLLFLQMYKENLLGMTGTFGSLYSKQFMEKHYNVNLVRVPLFKKSGFVETKAVFTKNHEEWMKEITTQTLKMTGDFEVKKRGHNPKPRAVLIICNSMQDVTLIAEEFRILLKAEQDKIYKKNYDKAVARAGFREKLKGELKNPPKYPPPSRRIRTIYNTDQMRKESKTPAKPGDIIVATNAAARGAEIGSTQDLIDNGNIDVNLTYIPDNRRILKQVYGRASRGGKPGTGHMTINRANYPQYSSPDLKLTVEKVKADMDLKEKGELAAFEGFEYTYRIVFMSEIFEKFKKTFNYIRWGSEVHVPGHVPPPKYHSETDNKRSYWNQVAEHWGLKYREYEAQLEAAKKDTKDKDALTKAKAAIIKDSDEFIEALKKKFDKVRDQTADDLTLFDNPAYLTNLGVIRFFKQEVKDAESAEKAFDKMIAKDKPFALAAQINRLYVEASKKVPGRSNILDDVTGATTNIHRLLDELNITRDILKNARGGLRKQLKNKEMIYNKLLKMLGDCRDVVETCKHPPKGYKSCKYVKLDDLTPLNEEFTEKEEAAMLDELKAFDKDGIFKYLYLSAHLVDSKGETHIYPFQEAPKKKKKRKVPTFMGIPLGSSPKRHKKSGSGGHKKHRPASDKPSGRPR